MTPHAMNMLAHSVAGSADSVRTGLQVFVAQQAWTS